jgi:plastocyanin
MSLVLADRVRQTTTSTGTGTITLDGSVEGFQSFTAIGNGNTTYYTISGGAQWEVGIGTYSSGTLARTTVISSSTGSKLDLTAGTKDVFVTLPASVAVTSGTDVTFTKVTSPTVQATNSAGLSLKNSSGTTQLSMGGGGGDNLTLSVSTNINGANAQVDISPTGTGHVHMKPTGTGSVEIAPTNAGTLDNLVIGGVTPKNGTFVNVAATTGTVSTAPSGGTDIVNKTYADGLAAKWGE